MNMVNFRQFKVVRCILLGLLIQFSNVLLSANPTIHPPYVIVTSDGLYNQYAKNRTYSMLDFNPFLNPRLTFDPQGFWRDFWGWAVYNEFGAAGEFGPLSGTNGVLGLKGPVGDEAWSVSRHFKELPQWNYTENTPAKNPLQAWFKDVAAFWNPFMPEGVLGPGMLMTDSYRKFASQVYPNAAQGGPFMMFGFDGVLGPNGPLGIDGSVGGHGFKSTDHGYFLDGERVTAIAFRDAQGKTTTRPLLELFSEEVAQRQINDSSWSVTGKVGRGEPDSYFVSPQKTGWVLLHLGGYNPYERLQLTISGQGVDKVYTTGRNPVVPFAYLYMDSDSVIKVTISRESFGHFQYKSWYQAAYPQHDFAGKRGEAYIEGGYLLNVVPSQDLGETLKLMPFHQILPGGKQFFMTTDIAKGKLRGLLLKSQHEERLAGQCQILRARVMSPIF